MRDRPDQIVLDTVRAATPPDAPSPLLRVERARFIRTGHAQHIAADVIMFDGLSASMTLTRWALGWSFGYETMEGGACWLDGREWRRETPYLPLFDAEHGNCIKAAREDVSNG